MGQGAEDANAAYDALEARGINAETFYGTRRKSSVRFASSVAEGAKPAGSTVVHRPTSDDEAKAIITALDHYQWQTHKVSGRFDRNPYTLKAKIDGQKHKIKLPGRFGGVLRWLDARERELAGVA